MILSRRPSRGGRVTEDGPNATTGTAQRYLRDVTAGWQPIGTP
ncbi:hypothetical protein AB0J38_07520 [Streptomyces sp. NPDC050095]